MQRLLDLVLPQRCLACGERGAVVCARCLDALPRLVPPFCERCGAPAAWPVPRCRECAGRRLAFASARAAVGYVGAAEPLVRGWKERGLRSLAALAAEVVVECVPRPDVAALTWVPAVPDRSLERGHSTAERLARELGRRWRLETAPLLERTRFVAPQRGLARVERRRNVAGAFRPRDRVPGSVCLVDDVFTTGATASAAASALRRGGSRRVDVVTFARALRSLGSD